MGKKILHTPRIGHGIATKKGPVFITSFTKASYEIENFTLTAFHFELNRAKNFNERENFKMPCKSN